MRKANKYLIINHNLNIRASIYPTKTRLLLPLPTKFDKNNAFGCGGDTTELYRMRLHKLAGAGV